MIGREQIAIMKHVSNSVLNKWIKHYKGPFEVMPHPLFIHRVYRQKQQMLSEGFLNLQGSKE
ncbi:hypothetical protein [Methanoculleus formosensis]|uniref:hypothetical protein n=1 Tax=Methanoculleus formosensis TaxID=2590886 RepID=UPI0021BEAB6E|nr:hypothetical protein [Methanoculleus sp. Afa-1]